MFETFASDSGLISAGGEVRLPFPLTQSDIADLFDVMRQSVQREVNQLRSLDIVNKQDGVWVVRDLARLRRLCT